MSKVIGIETTPGVHPSHYLLDKPDRATLIVDYIYRGGDIQPSLGQLNTIRIDVIERGTDWHGLKGGRLVKADHQEYLWAAVSHFLSCGDRPPRMDDITIPSQQPVPLRDEENVGPYHAYVPITEPVSPTPMEKSPGQPNRVSRKRKNDFTKGDAAAWTFDLTEAENAAIHPETPSAMSAVARNLIALDAKVEATAARTQEVLRARTDALGPNIGRVFRSVKDELIKELSGIVREETRAVRRSIRADIAATVNSALRTHEIEKAKRRLQQLQDSTGSKEP